VRLVSEQQGHQSSCHAVLWGCENGIKLSLPHDSFYWYLCCWVWRWMCSIASCVL